MSNTTRIEEKKQYFEERLAAHGATPRGVDWNSEGAQETRFAQLAKVIASDGQPFSLLDYGCGYGAFYDYLAQTGQPAAAYVGYDLLESMAIKGRELHLQMPGVTFTASAQALLPQDYLVASGIFNIKLDTPQDDWTQYVLSELDTMNGLCRRGFSFNMLTTYSDPEYMRPHLYYADPCQIFDYCKRHFSRNVALLHDYEVYDFTIIVRKNG